VIDAIVAEAYGLDRGQYEHILAGFSHRSYPKAPALCLAAFDELAAIGLDTFVKKHDPYSDIPLVETLRSPCWTSAPRRRSSPRLNRRSAAAAPSDGPDPTAKASTPIA